MQHVWFWKPVCHWPKESSDESIPKESHFVILQQASKKSYSPSRRTVSLKLYVYTWWFLPPHHWYGWWRHHAKLLQNFWTTNRRSIHFYLYFSFASTKKNVLRRYVVLHWLQKPFCDITEWSAASQKYSQSQKQGNLFWMFQNEGLVFSMATSFKWGKKNFR